MAKSVHKTQKIKTLFKTMEVEPKYVIYTCLGLLAFIAVALRVSFLHYQSVDYTVFFGSWYDFLKVHGIEGFKYRFSDYNVPYLYLLYISTLLPVSKIVAIKGISLLGDLLLAFGVYLIVNLLKENRTVAIIAGLTALFLPTVVINSAFWGQSDAIYTSFTLLSLYYLLRDRTTLAWAFWGLAIAFKLQAIFFFPVLIIASTRKIKLTDPLIALSIFLGLTLMPALEGRPVLDLLKIYFIQSKEYEMLTLHAPNLYQWIPSSMFHWFNRAGVLWTGAAVLFVILLSVIHKAYDRKRLLVITTLLFFMIPFLLPQMHERYFYPAEISSLCLAFIYPSYAWVAATMQVVTLLAYGTWLFNQAPVPLSILAFVVLFLIGGLAVLFWRSNNTSNKTPAQTSQVSRGKESQS